MTMSPSKVRDFLETHCTVREVNGFKSELNESNEYTHYLFPGQETIGIVQFKSKHNIICYITANIGNGKWVYFGDVVNANQRNFKAAFRTDYGVNEGKPGQFMPWMESVLTHL